MAYIGTKPANAVVTSAQIADGVIAPADLSPGAPFWNTSGNVGIGTSSPGGRLGIATGGSTDITAALGGTFPAYTYRNGSGAWFHAGKHPTSDYFYIGNGATPTTNINMVVNPSGDVGIGTASPNYRLSVNGTGNFYNGVAGLGRVFFGDPVDASGYIGIYRSVLGPSNSTTAGNGLNFASIDGYTFNTGPTVFGSQTERMRITSAGDVLVAASISENGNTRLSVRQSGAGSNCIWAHNTSTSDGASKFVATTAVTTASGTHFFYDAGYNWSTSFARAFAVRGDGVIFALNTTIQSLSDQRLKENIADSTDGLAIVTALRPVRFDWKKETGILKTNQLGFIAQEVEQVFPDAVDTYENSNDPQDPYKSVGSGALIPVLVKAIQEQQAMIEELKAEVALLKSQGTE